MEHTPTWCKVPHAVHSVFGLSEHTDDGGLLAILLLLDFGLGRHLVRPSMALISLPVGLTVLICH